MELAVDGRQKFSQLEHTHFEWHEAISGVFDEIVEIRRDLHANPELAFQETRTAGIVAGLLKDWGYEVQEGVGKTGVVGLLKSGLPGPVVALRADMDALPMMDEIEQPYRSKKNGVAHTCGHDAHTSILLGVAKLFSEKGLPCGTLKLVFQPAEEIGEGAAAMIADGVLENPKVDFMAGLHVHPTIHTGEFSVTEAEFSCAAVDIFELEVTGKGGHAAHPHQTIDPIMISAQILVALQQIVSRQIDPLDSVVLSFGQIEAGSKATIIPNSVLLKGTVRTLNPATRSQMPERMKAIAKGIAQSFGGDCKLDYQFVTPSIQIDNEARTLLAQTIGELFGEGALKTSLPSMGGEDFAYFSEKVPSVFFRLGTKSGEETAYPNHNTRFDVDEQAFLYGISVLSLLTHNYLKKNEGEKG
ncbi:M20 metallopeptidase family protein [Planococcus sp. YIM B11945]|uniref:M20 metallopeptidase family protein n=1 Tax=Planococcus sp. YIM B11945 TaxID=3435410 RepID=UPI003D7CD9C2